MNSLIIADIVIMPLRSSIWYQLIQPIIYIVLHFIILLIGTLIYRKVFVLSKTPVPPIADPKLSNSLRNCSFVLAPLWLIYVCGLIAISILFGMMYDKDEFVWLIWFRFIFGNLTFTLYYGLVMIALFHAFRG